MNFDDIQWLQENTSQELKNRVASDGTDTPFIYGSVGSILSIDGQVCIPVEAAQRSFDDYAEIEIRTQSGSRLGSLVLTEGYDLDLRSITDHFYMAYISEISRSLYGEAYQMHYSYVIVDSANYADYVDKYFDSAPLWGGFIHLGNPSLLVSPYKNSPPNIVASEGLSLPTGYHAEHVLRSVVQPFAFERFQKLYHLLELRFDLQIVERVNALGTDLKEIGRILSAYYGHDEMTRLKSVIEPGIKDLNTLEAKLNRVRHCSDCEVVARNIFFAYEKGKNPLKGKELEYERVMALGGLSKALASSNGLVGGSGSALDGNYRTLLVEMAVYWIYRVRSSIVHSKIGEYVMSSSDEEFVVEVAEPLLREVIVQVFRS
jgi:hypothetical protein